MIPKNCTYENERLHCKRVFWLHYKVIQISVLNFLKPLERFSPCIDLENFAFVYFSTPGPPRPLAASSPRLPKLRLGQQSSWVGDVCAQLLILPGTGFAPLVRLRVRVSFGQRLYPNRFSYLYLYLYLRPNPQSVADASCPHLKGCCSGEKKQRR